MAIKKRAIVEDDDAPFDADEPRPRAPAVHPPVVGRGIKRAADMPAAALGAVHHGAPKEPPSTARPVPTGMMRVVRNARGETAIELRREGAEALYVPLRVTGFALERMQAKEFDATYTEIAGYPLPRAATLYLGWSQHLGITEDALRELQRIAPKARLADESVALDNYGKPRGVSSAPKDSKPQIGKLIK